MIIVRLSGGMGNQLFQYAAGRALALKHNVPLAFDLTFLNHRVDYPHFLRPRFVFREYDLDVFTIEATIAQASDIRWWNRPILWGKAMLSIDAVLRKIAIIPGWERSFRYNKSFASLGPNAYLAGFWQSEKYFLDIAEMIRKELTLKESLPEKTQQLFDEIRTGNALCVHVRRSDMAAKSFHGACDLDYYLRGISHIAKQSPIETIYVFSDDIAWCEKNLQFPYSTVFVSNEHAGKKQEWHFTLMSAGTHFIIPNSTFSWWAAWLGSHPEKIVVAPKQWFAGKNIDTSDLIPKEWIRI